MLFFLSRLYILKYNAASLEKCDHQSLEINCESTVSAAAYVECSKSVTYEVPRASRCFLGRGQQGSKLGFGTASFFKFAGMFA